MYESNTIASFDEELMAPAAAERSQQPSTRPREDRATLSTLPAEIRVRIYHYTVEINCCIAVKQITLNRKAGMKLILLTDSPKLSTGMPNLMRACRQLRKEAGAIYYGQNCFVFGSTDSHFAGFLSAFENISAPFLKDVREIRMAFKRAAFVHISVTPSQCKIRWWWNALGIVQNVGIDHQPWGLVKTKFEAFDWGLGSLAFEILKEMFAVTETGEWKAERCDCAEKHHELCEWTLRE